MAKATPLGSGSRFA